MPKFVQSHWIQYNPKFSCTVPSSQETPKNKTAVPILISKYIDNYRKSTGKCTKTGMNWQQYHRYNTINNFVQCLASEYPDKATLYNIGKSYEGRDLHLLKITNNNRLAKSSIWIDGGTFFKKFINLSLPYIFFIEYFRNPCKRMGQSIIRNIHDARIFGKFK